MEIRKFKAGDIAEIIRLFKDTVSAVCAKDYSAEQIAAWTGGANAAKWTERFEKSYTLVAEEGGRIAAFGNIRGGYLDMLYTAKDFQGRGAGSAICDMLESTCVGDITVEASLTARGFFEGRGYEVLRRQTVERSGVKLENFVMSKRRK